MEVWRAIRGVVVSLVLVFIVAGCGSGGGGGVISNGGNATTVTVTFSGNTPVVVATQVGSGAFTAITPGSKVTFTVPSGTTKYAIAFLCPPFAGSTTLNSEIVIETTTQDSTTLAEACLASPATGAATGNASSSIAGTTSLMIAGQGSSTNVFGASGSFSLSMPVGSNDVAAVAIDGSQNVIGAKIVRSQTVPGVVGGTGIVLSSPGDATTSQSVTMTTIPSGFSAEALVHYHTANGTLFTLTNGGTANPQPYAVLPAASTQSGDFYHYVAGAVGTVPNGQGLGNGMSTTSGGGAVTLPLPAPWTYSGPTPAKLPTFTFNYSGFTGQATTEQALIIWNVGSTTTNQISVRATANFQNGANTITIPDLSGISGFLTPASTGTTINWIADVFAGTPEVVTEVLNPPANGSCGYVQETGAFTQP